MSFDTQYFSLSTVPYSGGLESAPKRVLICLDIQQNLSTHQPLLDTLSKHYDVYCLIMTNQSLMNQVFHWNPSTLALKQELSAIGEYIEGPIHCCIAQGFAATICGQLHIDRNCDILCNPSLPNQDISIARMLSRLLWGPTNSTTWFQKLIETSWAEQLPWPIYGPSPWISSSEQEQMRYPLKLSNATWKQVLTQILDVTRVYSPANIFVYLGSESGTISGTSPVELQKHFSNSIVQHCIFYGERQELLLADSVQQDILQTCKEYL